MKKCLVAVLPVAFLASCASKQDVVYFQDASNFETIVSDDIYAYKFKVDDVVSIHVSTLDQQASIPFNLFKGAEEGGIRPEQVDYIIDKDGNIDFPVLGAIKIE